MVNCSYEEEEILGTICRVNEQISDEAQLVGFELLACEILGVSGDRLYELIDEYKDTHDLDCIEQ